MNINYAKKVLLGSVLLLSSAAQAAMIDLST